MNGTKEVAKKIKRFATKYEARLHQHINIDVIRVLDKTNLSKRLKKKT